MGIFKKTYEIDPFPVHDKVRFKNVDEAITLYVRSDASVMVSNLNKINKRLTGINEETSDEEKNMIALQFAECLFGGDQAEELMDFYNEDALAVITVCGRYFKERLSKIITKAQKRG